MNKLSRTKHWELVVGKLVENYKLMDEAFTAAEKAGCIDPNGHLFSSVWRSYEHLIKLVDVDGWIEWHIFENSCGKSELKVSIGKRARPRKIKTSRDLAEVIAHAERTNQ